ncbi:MAG: DUF3365 domain-containing protein [Deltaproteobacteria bacterium]|nr:DUF3365 domain-containing protein [Deltaproteobacteria bacterium]
MEGAHVMKPSRVMSKAQRSALGAALLAFVFLACEREASPPRPSGGVASSSEASPKGPEAIRRAQDAIQDLGKTLKSRMLSAMGEGGPANAVKVCAQEAKQLTALVAERHKAKVGRASLRMRGDQEVPDWVKAWLDTQGERPAEGVQGFERIEEGKARVLRPIAVEGVCLNCHGETIAPEVEAVLQSRYPNDRARGYKVGDLRGAIWAEVAIE